MSKRLYLTGAALYVVALVLADASLYVFVAFVGGLCMGYGRLE